MLVAVQFSPLSRMLFVSKLPVRLSSVMHVQLHFLKKIVEAEVTDDTSDGLGIGNLGNKTFALRR